LNSCWDSNDYGCCYEISLCIDIYSDSKLQQCGMACNKILMSFNLVAVLLLHTALVCVCDVAHYIPHCCSLCNKSLNKSFVMFSPYLDLMDLKIWKKEKCILLYMVVKWTFEIKANFAKWAIRQVEHFAKISNVLVPPCVVSM